MTRAFLFGLSIMCGILFFVGAAMLKTSFDQAEASCLELGERLETRFVGTLRNHSCEIKDVYGEWVSRDEVVLTEYHVGVSS